MPATYYEKKADTNILKVEESYLNYFMPSHFHKAVELQYILEGSYEITIRGEQFFLQQDSVLVIPSYIAHSAKRQDETKTLLVIIPYEYFSCFSFFKHLNASHFVLSNLDFNRDMFLPILRFLHSQTGDASLQCNSNIATALNIGWTNLIYGTLFSFYDFDFSTKMMHNDSLEAVLEYIDAHCDEQKLSLSSLAAAFNYNPSYFSRLFQENFHISWKKYLNQIRIKNFIERYDSPHSHNILKLALGCGFNSQATFYRAFKEYTGINPTKYFSENKDFYYNEE